jgi:acyl dehydratase
MANLKEHVGRELGVSDWNLVDQARINQFAECTGDHQWIHVDPERAKRESPYRAAIAHGYLTLSLIGSLSQEIGVVGGGRAPRGQ